jgi:hypothetical protein
MNKKGPAVLIMCSLSLFQRQCLLRNKIYKIWVRKKKNEEPTNPTTQRLKVTPNPTIEADNRSLESQALLPTFV